MANMVVSGAETTGLNGVYEEVDARTHQWLQYVDCIGNIAYWKSSSSFGYGDCITSFGGLWYIGYFAGVDDGTSDIYKSSDGASSPNLVGSWFYYAGNPSNATVTAEGEEPEPPTKKIRYKPISQLTGRIGQLGY